MPEFKKMPNGAYIYKDKDFGTSYKQRKDGTMDGRDNVKGKGDGVGVRRVKKPFVLVKRSGRARGHVRRVHYEKGMIVGRWS